MRAVSCLVAVVLAACLAPGCARGPRAVVTPSGLTYTVVTPGTGEAAVPGAYVTIHETTSLADGRVHFTTQGRAPIRFLLGGKQVIDGLDEGVTGMKVGERRRLVVPPAAEPPLVVSSRPRPERRAVLRRPCRRHRTREMSIITRLLGVI